MISVTQGPPQSGSSYTTTDTGGSSCDQIIKMTGVGKGHVYHGCSNSVMEDWYCSLFFEPTQVAKVFESELIATTKDAFARSAAADAQWVRGRLATVGTYGIQQEGHVVWAESLTNSTMPAISEGFYYILRPGERCSSWQSFIDAEPRRDTMLP